MPIVKLLLRAENGAPVSSLTLREAQDGASVTLPGGAALLAATDEAGRPIPFEARTTEVSFSASPAAILLEKDGAKLYAFRESGGSLSYKKWTLLSAANEEPLAEETPITTPKTSDNTEETEIVAAPADVEETREAPVREENIAEDISPETETPASPLTAQLEREEQRRKLREIFDRGEPFPGFERLIEGSKWVRMPEEDYLIGILEEGDETIVLYGVPGRLGEAPDDNCDWTFLPASEENEDWGYYICKSSDLE